MSRRPATAWSLAGLALLCAAGLPGPASAATADAPAPSAEWGRKTYVSFCTRCHGINLVTSSSAHFDLRTFPADDKARFERSVTQGVRAMPAWGGLLKPGQLESLWLYIGQVNGWPAAGATAAAPALTSSATAATTATTK